MKICSKCGISKSIRNFLKRPTGSYETQCKSCKYAYTQRWRMKNKKKLRAAEKRWRKQNQNKVLKYKKNYRLRYPERARQQVRKAYHKKGKIYRKHRYFSLIKERYGLTKKQIQCQEKIQKHRCAICSKKQKCGNRTRLYVDHNHETNKFRGLLCFACNAMLGFAKDNTATLQAALAYIVKDKNNE